MLRNYILVAFRNLRKQWLHACINSFGLALGLMMGIFVLLYIHHEWRYDQWISESEQIFRVNRLWHDNSGQGSSMTPGPVAAALRDEVAGVTAATRIVPNHDMLLSAGAQKIAVPKEASVDNRFFQVISWPFVHGDPSTAFAEPHTVVLSTRIAQLLFGTDNPIGKTVVLEASHLLTVTGVLAPPPGPTHLDYDIYVHEDLGNTSWTGANGYTYVKLHRQTHPTDIAQSLTTIAERETQIEYRQKDRTTQQTALPRWDLQSIKAIHLQSTALGANAPTDGSPLQITLLTLLGLLVVLLAGVNYVNLATANASRRAVEVGIRKVTGATRSQMIGQFLTESVIQALLALILALLLGQLLLPFFNEVVSRPLQFGALWSGPILVAPLLLALVVGLLAGSYPAFVMARYKTIDTLRKVTASGRQAGWFRNTLTVAQFSLSITLLLLVSFIGLQVRYMTTKDLGFTGAQIAVFRLNTKEQVDAFPALKEEVLKVPGVIAATQVARVPGDVIPNYGMKIGEQTEKQSINLLLVDADWQATFDVPLTAGRFLSSDYQMDEQQAFVVNEAFVKQYGLDNPLDQSLQFAAEETSGRIVGVVADFHYQGVEQDIAPLVLAARPDKAWMGRVAVRLRTENVQATISALADFWRQIEPEFPVTYFFQDQHFAQQYAAYARYGRTVFYTTVLCVVIAFLGLFGITAFVVQRRSKELSIRKVFGAAAPQIIRLFLRQFVGLIVIAGLIAAPVGYLLAKHWLQRFAYRIELSPWIFVGVMGLMLCLATLTVVLKTWRAANRKPIVALRSE